MRGTTGQAVVACLAGLAVAGVLAVTWPSSAQTEDRLLARVRQEQAAYLATLKDLVAIESGSRDSEGLDRAATFVAARLRALGGEVELVPAPADMARLEDTPAQPGKTVVARFRGTGKGRVLLLSHMDTVYERGSAAKQPFRIEGDRAYGLGISDDKSGVALAIQAVAGLNGLESRAGAARNIIPAAADATADARVLRVRDWDALEAKLKERITRKLIPDTQVTVTLERRRPPLEPTAASRAMAAQAAKIYQSIGRRLRVLDRSEGGGTDAAFAALKTRAPVVEGFGPIGAGAHSDERESIDLR